MDALKELLDVTRTMKIVKYKENPILSAADVPYESVQTYNAGITKYRGRYVMAFRNDYNRKKEDFEKGYKPAKINIGLAFSDDGIKWHVERKPCFELKTDDILYAYDPRLTVIDDRCYMCFAVGTLHGVRAGIAVTDDFSKFEILSMSVPDNRNMVLFPEKINGKFIRLERPFPVYGRREKEAFDIWISDSPDAAYWGNHKLLLGAESVAFSNSKIGPAAPPVKTAKGWLTTFHAVYKVERELYAWHKDWHKVYFGGLMLLDLEDPSKIIGICKYPILAPELPYELVGMRGEVIFPGGMILEDSGEVKIYYGSADTVECLATADVDDLIKACLE
ncbi:MAG: glycosidase [Lentisphaerae bacterium GWF2_44_16]|nr:MAG: glycosidase [Lentisphaerae bacterium GWF2_44_16]